MTNLPSALLSVDSSGLPASNSIRSSSASAWEFCCVCPHNARTPRPHGPNLRSFCRSVSGFPFKNSLKALGLGFGCHGPKTHKTESTLERVRYLVTGQQTLELAPGKAPQRLDTKQLHRDNCTASVMHLGLPELLSWLGPTGHLTAAASKNSVKDDAPTSGTTSASIKWSMNFISSGKPGLLSRWLQLATTSEARQSACEAHVLSNRRPRADVMLRSVSEFISKPDPPLTQPLPACQALLSDGMQQIQCAEGG